jgi:hypothetical protein
MPLVQLAERRRVHDRIADQLGIRPLRRHTPS